MIRYDQIEHRIMSVETCCRAVPNIPASLLTAHHFWPRRDVKRFMPTQTVNTVVTRARVNHGRWVVDCPFCASAQLAAKSDPRFFCSECLMEAVNHCMVYVIWPSADKVAEIEAVLCRRTDPEHRNWTIETIDELRAENARWGSD